MKKIFFVLFAIVMFVVPVCFAEEVTAASEASNTTSATSIDTSSVIGRVDSATSRSGVGGKKPRITLRDSQGHTIIYIVESDTIILDKNGNPTTLEWIPSNAKVKLGYVTGQDSYTKTATSIEVLPDF